MNIILWLYSRSSANTLYITLYYGANAYNRRNIMMLANYKEINIKFVMQGIESVIRITYAQGYYECEI